MFALKTVPQGERVLVWNAKGEAKPVDGPKRLLLIRERIQPLHRYAAEPNEYLIVKRLDGRTEHIVGPATIWFNPLEHLQIKTHKAIDMDSNEALVVYQRTKERVIRRIVQGPCLFVPMADEWIHHFSWHGTDPRNGKKVPSALQFEKLRVIPDQMYFDVENVRTKDDTLLVVKLMLFFELGEIEKMLDQTHDPIADFINALSADIIDFVGDYEFEAFKSQADALNQLGTYAQLLQRAEKIGYRISKVVYRGYYASEKLQAMHDGAIECRTRLRLEAETEKQTQELADLKLTREIERAQRRQEMNEAEAVHKIRLVQLDHQALIEQKQAEERQKLEAKRNEDAARLEVQKEELGIEMNHQTRKHEEEIGYFARMKELQVDLTRYLVAQYQNPDKVIRIDSGNRHQPQLHLHEN